MHVIGYNRTRLGNSARAVDDNEREKEKEREMGGGEKEGKKERERGGEGELATCSRISF